MSIDIIYLDVDEVLAAWVDGALDLFGFNPVEVHRAWDLAQPRPWDLFDVIPLSPAEGWKRIDEAGADFWADLPVFPWATDVYALCSSYAPTYLLTSPSKHPSCAAGKTAWIQRVFGSRFRDYFIGPVKYAHARPGALLVDDSPSNCAHFTAPPDGRQGGHALIFPGAGNVLHVHRHDPLPYVRSILRRS